MGDSKPILPVDYEGLKSLQSLREKQLLQRRLQTKIGGVISLKSLWSATCPEKLRKIKGHTAVVKAKECGNGLTYLYIEIPFIDGEYEELRVGRSDLEEDDEVDIFSIIAIFIDKDNGETIVRYDARYLEENSSFNLGDVKSDIIDRCTGLMMDYEHTEMSINITYEGEECPPINYGIIKGDNNVTLHKWYEASSSGLTLKIVGYRNAKPLTHGLILAERKNRKYCVLTANGSVMCDSIDKLDFGPDYLTCKSRLWWYNNKTNLWEEKETPRYKCNIQEDVASQSLSLKKVTIGKDRKFYIYNNSVGVKRCIQYTESDYEWEFDDWKSCLGLLDEKGIWRVEASMLNKRIEHCHSIIIVYKEDNCCLYNSKSISRGFFKEIMTIDKCEFRYGKYLLLIKDSLQGVYDAETESLVVPCCLDAKYTLNPNTIRDGLIGVYAIVDKKSGKHTFLKRKYYFLDYQGNIKLEIEDGWIIDSGFRDGQAIISMKDDYHGDYYERTIDINGNVLKEDYRSFSGIYSDYEKEDQRNQDRDIWDAMTDGMYGDYPEEGFDGDYESIGF